MTQATTSYEESIKSLRAYIMAWARQGRDARLSATDYIFLPDVSISAEDKDALVQYRAVLRDFPAEFSAVLSAMSEDELYSVTPESITYPKNT